MKMFMQNISRRILLVVILATVLAGCQLDEKEQIVVTFGPSFYAVATEGSALPATVGMTFSLPLYVLPLL